MPSGRESRKRQQNLSRLDGLKQTQNVRRGKDEVSDAGGEHKKETQLARFGWAGRMARQVEVIQQDERDGVDHSADESDNGGDQNQRTRLFICTVTPVMMENSSRKKRFQFR
jgi:hypothetical protein